MKVRWYSLNQERHTIATYLVFWNDFTAFSVQHLEIAMLMPFLVNMACLGIRCCHINWSGQIQIHA